MILSTFDEDRLPADQPPIMTSSVKRLNGFVDILTEPSLRYSTIGVVTASAGTGKTIASQICHEMLLRRFHTVLPVCIRVKVVGRSTSRTLLTDILTQCGEKPKRARPTIQQLSDDAVTSIERNDLRLIILDESDRLRDDSFEVVRYLLDKTGCPHLLVGLPKILTVIEGHEKFDSRVGRRMSFHPLELDEVLKVVLPELVFPFWTFDPNNEDDRIMGIEIWRKVHPSLRKLRNLLETASTIAKVKKVPKITLPIVREAYTWALSQNEHPQQSLPMPGTHEDIANQRRAAKEGTHEK
jgi:Cdc6-like AAA superfamily ATPase